MSQAERVSDDQRSGVQLFIGGDAQNLQGRRFNLAGRRCFSAAYGPGSRYTPAEAEQVAGLLDSGAFSDAPEDRLTPAEALQRQLAWEERAREVWGSPGYVSEALVSYDLLIDEKWTGGRRRKERWSVADAEQAVATTVEAAAFLASQRAALAPRRLVLACQGVDAQQYEECVREVLEHATPADWIGLGGWCILGWHRSWIPVFWATLRRVLPLVAETGIKRVHIFGVMYRPVLGRLLWACDQHGLALSTDSSGPALSVAWKDQRKAGVLAPTWEENCAAWTRQLAGLRESEHYRRMPVVEAARQLTLWD